MARRTKRLWTDEEKRSICFQTTATGVLVAQLARRYAICANVIFRCLREANSASVACAYESRIAKLERDKLVCRKK